MMLIAGYFVGIVGYYLVIGHLAAISVYVSLINDN